MAIALTEDLYIRILGSMCACRLLFVELTFFRKCCELNLSLTHASKTIDSYLSKLIDHRLFCFLIKNWQYTI
jgi:hypothetical protein